jgi:Protein of unknown function (DUF1194)
MATRVAWGMAALLGLASPALAEDCRLALVLALDVSSSVDVAEHRLQREGLVQALLAPEVVRAFLAGDPVALYAFEWSSPSTQVSISSGWQTIAGEEDLLRIAAHLAAHRRIGRHNPHPSTGVGAALAYATTVLQEGPDCRARTVDISGDGVNNDGFGPDVAYAAYPFDGVTVNALVVRGAQHNIRLSETEAELVAWFAAEVLQGPGAFLVVAAGYEDFERAMIAKLLRELEVPVASGALVADPAG